jgi:hypothetical protein
MARLYLHCALCNRKQASGLLSGAAWGRLALPPGAAIDHPGLEGAELRVCPTCIDRHANWSAELLESLGVRGEGHGMPIAQSQ